MSERSGSSRLRRTQQRSAIRRALVDAGRPLSPQEIADAAKAHAPGVGLATVYRTLRRLSEEGWLVAIDLPGESARYELAGKKHHHHFRCVACGGVFELAGCPTTPLEGLLPRGFQLAGHDILLYGRCDACSACPT
ncbi:MAG TPA: transcriptional repressor [Planctomycetota bacterium]|nr:transcriptional repressor [Planctomycetota bacterium]